MSCDYASLISTCMVFPLPLYIALFCCLDEWTKSNLSSSPNVLVNTANTPPKIQLHSESSIWMQVV